MKKAQLTDIHLPDFGTPQTEPLLAPEIYIQRHHQLLARIATHNLDAMVIYGDR